MSKRHTSINLRDTSYIPNCIALSARKIQQINLNLMTLNVNSKDHMANQPSFRFIHTNRFKTFKASAGIFD